MKYGIIDYEILGEGTPVLIIHGWGIDRTTMQAAFEMVFEALGGYKRYYIDLPGMGRSEHGDVHNSDDILALLHGFAEEIIGEPFILVGQSYGGLLARGYSPEDAAALGVWIHGYAGDCLSRERSEEGFSSRDLIDYLWKGFYLLYKE